MSTAPDTAPASDTGLRRRVADLTDRAEIADLFTRHCHWLDAAPGG
ncbi:hypothetical protein [Nocardiopsis potens]|nr:hypothetical protein [Nocardiopsis potens]